MVHRGMAMKGERGMRVSVIEVHMALHRVQEKYAVVGGQSLTTVSGRPMISFDLSSFLANRTNC